MGAVAPTFSKLDTEIIAKSFIFRPEGELHTLLDNSVTILSTKIF